MALSIQERRGRDQVEWIDNWPFPILPTLISSHAFELLKREFGRYVRNEVPGRAFLVSGHRGAGKTTLVVRAIDEINREILRSAFENASQDTPTGQVAAGQRPLLVRLHGPSLLDSRPAGDGAPTETPDLLIRALEQIMVGLYRALASEIGRGATQFANAKLADAQGRSIGRGDLAEAAAQFILDLDNAPKPALLRESYRRMDCLRTGVLWPRNVGLATVRAGLRDQGMREIVALSTAAQVFEICAGEVKASDSTTKTSSNSKSIEWKIDLALADIINKALGLVAGIAIGIGAVVVGHGSPWAIAAGAAVGIVTAATYSRTAKRAISSERKTEYSFVRDRTKRSLDRDLPGVIERIREAGLAPIFVVDELDKIASPDVSIADFINKVKNLTTDFGCFCFLTDRAYFDNVMGKIVAQPFPPEHTYFSHWLFVLNNTSRMLEYLNTAIVARSDTPTTMPQVVTGTDAAPIDASSAPAEQPAVTASTPDELPKTILALYLIHRSKLNTVDLFREIGRCCDDRGRVRAASGAISSSLGLRIAATIQLAFHLVMEQAAMRERIETDPRFAQSAVDALYIVSRAWEAGAAEVLLTREAIKAEMSARMKGHVVSTSGEVGVDKGPDDLADSGSVVEGETPGARDLEIIAEHVWQLATLLSDLQSLVEMPEARLGVGLSAPPNQVAPVEVMSGLIEEVEPGSRRYRFLYDVQGRGIQVREALAADASTSNPTRLRERIAGVEVAEQFRSLLVTHGASLDDLGVAGILPPILNPIAFDGALDRLRALRDRGRPYEDLASDLQILDVLNAFLNTHWTAFADVMRLAKEVAAVAGCPLGNAILAVGRCIDLSFAFRLRKDRDGGYQAGPSSLVPKVAGRPGADRSSGENPRPVTAPSTVLAGMRALGDELGDRGGVVGTRIAATLRDKILDTHIRSSWAMWMQRLRTHAAEDRPVVDAPHFSDIVCTAADLAPASLFEMDLRRMTVASWSAICLQGFPNTPKGSAPGWSFVAGLWGLGFDKALLTAASEVVRKDEEGCAELLAALIATAPSIRVQSIILIMSERRLSLGLQTDHRPESYGHPSNRKILALRENELALYSRALAWLEARGAVSGLVYEE